MWCFEITLNDGEVLTFDNQCNDIEVPDYNYILCRKCIRLNKEYVILAMIPREHIRYIKRVSL